MKNAVLFLTVVCMSIGVSFGDYANPPGWENDAYFTHQSWSFSGPANPSEPDDGGAGNPYGTAIMELNNAEHVDDLGMVYDIATFDPLGQRQGGFKISGPQEGTEFYSVNIPNLHDPRMHKELWFEITFLVSDMALAGVIQNVVNLAVYADGIIDDDHDFDYFDENGGVIGASALGEIWLRFEGKFNFDPQPDSELMLLTGNLEPGQYVILDQIDIDTRCVPEPASLGLLGVGVLGLIRRKR